MLGRGGPTEREPPRPARFAAGDRVRARNLHPRTHTRLPRYARGRMGTVVTVHGCHVFPDVHARGGDEDPQWLYTVRFAARALWGDAADPAASVSIDAPLVEGLPLRTCTAVPGGSFEVRGMAWKLTWPAPCRS